MCVDFGLLPSFRALLLYRDGMTDLYSPSAAGAVAAWLDHMIQGADLAAERGRMLSKVRYCLDAGGVEAVPAELFASAGRFWQERAERLRGELAAEQDPAATADLRRDLDVAGEAAVSLCGLHNGAL